MMQSFSLQILNLIEEEKDNSGSRSSSFIETEYHIYLLANPKIGSQEAKRYTDLEFQNCTIPFDDGVQAVLYVYNLVDAKHRKKCFKKIVKIQKQNDPIHRVRLVIAGGDGSLIGTVTEAI